MQVSLVKELDFKRNGKSLKGLLWSEIFVSPQNSYVENLVSKLIVLGVGAFQR